MKIVGTLEVMDVGSMQWNRTLKSEPLVELPTKNYPEPAEFPPAIMDRIRTFIQQELERDGKNVSVAALELRAEVTPK